MPGALFEFDQDNYFSFVGQLDHMERSVRGFHYGLLYVATSEGGGRFSHMAASGAKIAIKKAIRTHGKNLPGTSGFESLKSSWVDQKGKKAIYYGTDRSFHFASGTLYNSIIATKRGGQWVVGIDRRVRNNQGIGSLTSVEDYARVIESKRPLIFEAIRNYISDNFPKFSKIVTDTLRKELDSFMDQAKMDKAAREAKRNHMATQSKVYQPIKEVTVAEVGSGGWQTSGALSNLDRDMARRIEKDDKDDRKKAEALLRAQGASEEEIAWLYKDLGD